jgi:2-keto-4-pentenoate hydratase/2-oxohepta-3-ene-1,7-dioic acid hydratase in catechol pathway
VKFVCYKEYDDPEEPTFPGLLHKGKTLPLARVVAVAEAIHPRGLAVPDDLNDLVAALPQYTPLLKELERAKVLDQIWQEVGIAVVAPLPRPNRIFAIGRNYREHAEELGNAAPEEPIVFVKTPNTVIGPDKPIVIPAGAGRIDFEGELAVVIGRGGKNISEAEALSHVAGYTLFNDVTARDEQKRLQARSLPWYLAKNYDTFGPLGPCLVTADEIKNPATLEITTRVNDQVKQQGKLSDLLFPIPKLIAFLSHRIALEAGDVIATGTPPGVGPLQPGDTVEIEIAEIGILSNPVVAEEDL